jgi:AhpD family alkylhydroperoxidase
MARIPLVQEQDHPELSELVEKLRSGRRGNLINTYRLLLHSPSLAQSWFEHSNAVRWKTSLDGRLREIVIIRVAILNRCDYVINQHIPELALPEGLTMDECEALRDWRTGGAFSAREQAALAYADSMTRDIEVPDEVFANVSAHFNDREIVELTVLIASYAMNTRVLQALKVDRELHHR